MSTYILRKGVSTLSDLADGLSAIGLVVAAGGTWYYCDPTNGTSGGDGKTPGTANSNLLTVYNLCRDGKNDGVFFIGGSTAYEPAAAFTWSKSYTHLVGLSNGLPGLGSRCRIVNNATTALATLFTISGSGCLFANLKFADEKDKAEVGQNVLVSGSRNHFVNIEFAGMIDATAGSPFAVADSYSLKVSGSENAFERCTIGVDTTARTAANHELWISGARNNFYSCDIRCNSTTAGKFLVKIDNSVDDMRETIFDNCIFICYTTNWAAGINNAFSTPAGGNTFWVFLKNCQLFGTSVTWADNVTHVLSGDAAPNAGAGVAVAITT